MSDKKDSLVVGHVHCKEKNEYLHVSMQEPEIKMWTDTECIALGNRYNFWSQEMFKGDKSAKELLTEGAESYNADIIVVGFHGRKGPKGDPTIMGSAV